jgi:hypothetical protein
VRYAKLFQHPPEKNKEIHRAKDALRNVDGQHIFHVPSSAGICFRKFLDRDRDDLRHLLPVAPDSVV